MVPALKVLRTLGAPWRTDRPPRAVEDNMFFLHRIEIQDNAVTSAA